MGTKHEITATIFDKKGRVLSVGKNSYTKTHPYQAEMARVAGQPEKQFLHAEIDALIRCRGEPYKIKVERVNKKGKYMLAKPCSICELAIKRAGVKFIEFSI